MGTVGEVFRWNSIGPDATVGVFIHPYRHGEFAAFNIIVDLNSNQPPGAYTSIAAQLTDGPTNLFFGDMARTLWVQNKTVGPQPYITVGLLEFDQSG
jgi:hypothetical protein